MSDPISELAKMAAERHRVFINSRYGEFIIQTNYIQYLLGLAVIVRTPTYNEKFSRHLETSTLGKLIGYFRICAKNTAHEVRLLNSLGRYKKSRDNLAHKMFTKNRLSEKDCESSIELGKKLISAFTTILKS